MAELIRNREPSMLVPEVAQLARLSEKAVRAKIRDGTLPARKVGRVYLIRPEHVAEMLGISA